MCSFVPVLTNLFKHTRIYICLKPKLWAKDPNTEWVSVHCTYTYCAFSNLQYANVHRQPLCGNCTCVPQWLSYKVVRRPSPWGTWTFQITFPGERGGFLFTMTLPSKLVSTTFEALFFFHVKRLKSGMENKYLNPFISHYTVQLCPLPNLKMFPWKVLLFFSSLNELFFLECWRHFTLYNLPEVPSICTCLIHP